MPSRDLSQLLSRRSMLILACVGILMTTAIAILSHTALDLLSGVRAYVGGEGLWSKAQKDAVHWLHRYADSRDERAYETYLAAIAVPLGDRAAREEMERPDPDEAIVRRGLIQGRNHPDDVEAMSWLFRDFRSVGYMERATRIWKRGDLEIARLVLAGNRLHRAVRAGAPPAAVAPILEEIDAVNARVTPLEDQFSFTLGEAARWARNLALAFIVGATTLFFLLGALVVQKLVRKIAASEERYRTVTETATDGILSVDEGGRILFVNAAAARIFGYTPERMVGRSVAELAPNRLRREVMELVGELRDPAEGPQGGVTHRVYGRHRDGREIPLEFSFGESRDGDARVITGVIRDITLRLEAENQIERLAYEDPLTGLPNRALFHDRLRQALAHAHREGERFALMFLDLDDFKIINDSLGHTFGDAVLREIGRRIVSCLRAQDTAARLGGDEFIVLLPRSEDPASVGLVAQKILDRLSAPIELQGETLFVTASIGVSLFPGDGRDPETLLRNADMAMYRAKEHGANAYEFFTPKMDEQLSIRYAMHQALHRGLDRQEFSLKYQPIWRTADERIVGVEALLRWTHPERGELRPDDFIPVAEASPLMLALGEWVLTSACGQLRQWLDEGLPVQWVSVNLSARQFQQSSLPDTVDRILRESGLSPERVLLEITETAVTKNLEQSVRTLTALRRRGFRILMDDFGSGHASIGSLRRLPVDVLKIDQHLIEQIDRSSTDATMVRAIIEMSHGLGLSVVAEGVSRASQLDFLRAQRCDEFQGFLLSPPLPPEEVGARILDRIA